MTELRASLRRLVRTPGYTSAFVLTLGLALGTNGAIFSAVETVLLRPSPVTDPTTLVVTWAADTARGQAVVELAHRHLREWTGPGTPFASAAAMGSHNWSGVIDGGAEPVRVWYSGVTASFFETLGVAPIMGRTLHPDDEIPTAPIVAVLSHGMWMRHFDGDPDAVGRAFTLNGNPVQVVGVMPAGFEFPRGADFWRPVVPILAGAFPNGAGLDSVGLLYLVGRLRPGHDAETARQAIEQMESRLRLAAPGRPPWGDAVVTTPYLAHVFGPTRAAIWALWGAVTLLLVMTCVNVTGLVLARAADRGGEHAIRAALGASRGRLAQSVVVETALLTTAAMAVGVLTAFALSRAVTAVVRGQLPEVGPLGIDAPVVFVTLAFAVATAIVASLAPIRQAQTAGASGTPGSGPRSTTGRRTRRTRSILLVVQTSLAVVLLAAAGLVVRSFANLQQVDPGFSDDRTLAMIVQPRNTGVPPNEWMRMFLAEVRRLDGVEAAGSVYLRPLALGAIGQDVTVVLEGQVDDRTTAERNPILNHQIATPGYFEALGVAVRRGRVFDDRDTATSERVAVVSESTARRLWPGEDAVGRRLSMAAFAPGAPRAWRTVIGVVADVHYRGLNDVRLDVYDPAAQVARPADQLVVRSDGDPLVLAPAVRDLARRLNPDAVVDGVTTMAAVLDRERAPWRLSLWLFGVLATLATALVAAGVFGVVSMDVTDRGREFAVRAALGGSPGSIVRAALGRTLAHAAVGVVVGLGLALGTSRVMTSALFGVQPTDPVTYLAITLLLAAVMTLAVAWPLGRALRTNPASLLRG